MLKKKLPGKPAFQVKVDNDMAHLTEVQREQEVSVFEDRAERVEGRVAMNSAFLTQDAVSVPSPKPDGDRKKGKKKSEE